ncbi:PilZ domain-containing protein [uncultured Intestinimonas sp.]|uniref:PilZ domain-containing protein n=1 Tax=uncultured Intestinimonas sp. TaxID=1689265 RepID=UPI00341C4EAB
MADISLAGAGFRCREKLEEGDRLLLSVLQLLEDGLEYTFRCLVQRLEGGEKKGIAITTAAASTT